MPAVAVKLIEQVYYNNGVKGLKVNLYDYDNNKLIIIRIND